MSKVADKYRGTKDYALVYSELITAARYRGTLPIKKSPRLIGLPLQGNFMGAQIGHLLGEISDDEVSHGRPMLSAVVVNTTGTPGPGFFGLAVQLGMLDSTDKDKEQAFLKKEQRAIYETWRVDLGQKD